MILTLPSHILCDDDDTREQRKIIIICQVINTHIQGLIISMIICKLGPWHVQFIYFAFLIQQTRSIGCQSVAYAATRKGWQLFHYVVSKNCRKRAELVKRNEWVDFWIYRYNKKMKKNSMQNAVHLNSVEI